jgi:hypothetical protein
MELESMKLQLIARMNALKQQEQALESVLRSAEQEQQTSISSFKSDISSALDHLHSIRSTFSAVSGQIDALHSLATDVSSGISPIDLAILRCTETASHVRHYSDLTECLGSIDDHIQARDIPKSVDFVHRLMGVPASLLSQENARKVAESRTAVLRLLRQAMEADGADQIGIFNFFCACQGEIEGLGILADLQYRFILDATRVDYVALSQLQRPAVGDDSAAPHLAAYVKFLDCIAQRMLVYKPLLSEPGHFAVFIRLLLERCDDRITDIIRKFSDFRAIPQLEGKSSTTDVELSLLDRVNDEIAGFAKQWSLFETFVKRKLESGLNTRFFTECRFKDPTIAATGFPQQQGASRALMDLLMSYLSLTESFLRSVSSNLIGVVKSLSQNEEVTNAIVDLFFVYHRVLDRSLETHTVMTTCTLLNVISEIIRSSLAPVLQVKAPLRKFGDVTAKPGVMVNACALCAQYVQKLVSLSETSIARQFSGDALAAIQSGIGGLKECGTALEDGLKLQIDAMANDLTDSCHGLASSFRDVQWEKPISAQTEAQLQNDFKTNFGRVFGSHKRCLSETNFERLMGLLTPRFAHELEEVVAKKKFSLSGGVLLKRAIPMLISLFECESPFERLNDMVTVLSLAEHEDIATVWGKRARIEKPVKFNLNELKAVINLRIDWAGKDLGFLLQDS